MAGALVESNSSDTLSDQMLGNSLTFTPQLQELMRPDAPDASSDEEDSEQVVTARFWRRRALYLSGNEADLGLW
jgi:hypothetical protein